MQGRHRHQRGAGKEKQREDGVENRVAGEREHGRVRREQQRGDQRDLRRTAAMKPSHAVTPISAERRQRRRQAGGKLGGPGERHRNALQPVEENRFVEKRLLVVVRRQPVAGLDQLARGFGVVRLVRIPEGRRAEPPEQYDEDHDGEREQRQEHRRLSACGRSRHDRD